MSDNQSRPPIKKTYLGYTKMRLFAVSDGFRGSLEAALINNNPRFVVWSRDPADSASKSSGKQAAVALGAQEYFIILNQFRLLLNFRPTEAQRDMAFIVQARGGEDNKVESELHAGRDSDGIFWISVIKEGFPKFKFKFGTLSKWTTFCDANGAPINTAQLSGLHFSSWVAALERMTSQLMVDNFDPNVGSGQGSNKDWKSRQGGQARASQTTHSDDDYGI